MSLRSNIILFAIAVFLTIYYAIWESAPAPGIRTGFVFPDLEPKYIRELRISQPASSSHSAVGAEVREIVLRREKYGDLPEGWWIVKPFRYRGLHPRIQGIVYLLSDLKRVAEVPEGEVGFPPEGPTLVLAFTDDEGTTRTVELGRDHPDPALKFTYARVDGEVFVTEREFRTVTQARLNDLRSRALFPVPLDETKGLSITKGGQTTTFERIDASGRWRLREPLDVLADRTRLDAIVNDLNGWKIERYIQDSAADVDLPQYGLDTPLLLVKVEHKAGYSVELAVGKALDGQDDAPSSEPDRLYYVRHSGKPFVYAAKAEALDLIPENTEEYRSRYVFDFGLADINGVRLERTDAAGGISGFDLKLSEATEGQTAGWTVTDLAKGTSFPGDRRVIATTVGSLKRLRVERFSDTPDIGNVWGTLRITDNDSRTLELLLGERSDDELERDSQFYRVRRPGEPGAYVVVTPLKAQADEGAHTFWKRDFSEVATADVRQLEIRSGERRWIFAQLQGRWLPSSDSRVRQTGEFRSELVTELLEALQPGELQAVDYWPKIVDFETLGIASGNAERTILFRGLSDAQFTEILIGRAIPDTDPPEFIARVNDKKVPPFSIGATAVIRFEELVEHLREISE